jgi:hypothetical protein
MGCRQIQDKVSPSAVNMILKKPLIAALTGQQTVGMILIVLKARDVFLATLVVNKVAWQAAVARMCARL